MTLAVIGAGFGRTGTESMKLALEQLGLGPCHHMLEVLRSPAQVATWRAVVQGSGPEWDEVYAGYHSAVDWPTAYYWRELGERYPDAKIVLTTRSVESWYESFSKTILPVMQRSTDPDSLGLALVRDRVFGGRIDDPAHIMSVYEQNVRDVQATVPRSRLLTYTIGDGWEPLCRFLDEPVPSEPFPRTNSKEDFNTRLAAVVSVPDR
jgi:hypothetical protein